MQQRVLLYQVLLTHSISLTDVPFTNGQYIHECKEGESEFCSFQSLSTSNIISDSSFRFIFLFIHRLGKSQKSNIILLETIIIHLYISSSFVYSIFQKIANNVLMSISHYLSSHCFISTTSFQSITIHLTLK